MAREGDGEGGEGGEEGSMRAAGEDKSMSP